MISEYQWLNAYATSDKMRNSALPLELRKLFEDLKSKNSYVVVVDFVT